MKTVFADVLEKQKKAFDMWSDLSANVIKNSTTNGTKAFATQNQSFLTDWYTKQNDLLKETLNTTNPTEAIEKAPENFKKMLDVQVDYFNKWREAFGENLNKSMKEIPGFDSKAYAKSYNDGLKQWSNWITESTKWMEENLTKNIPASMRPAFDSFQSSYATIQKIWEPITKMIEHNAFQADMIEKFFPTDFYKNVVDQMMGFKLTGNPSEMLEHSNKMFENWISTFQKSAPNYEKWTQWAEETAKAWDLKHTNPYFGMFADMSSQLRSSVEPFFNIMDNNKQTEIIKIAKDIQFATSSYIIKNAELQTKIYDKARKALPGVIKHFSTIYTETKTLPQYMDFFKKYMDMLEKEMLSVLDTKEYSVLQSEVSSLAINIKSKMDNITEITLRDLPILTKSAGDDISKEIADLKRKVRTLENDLKEAIQIAKTANNGKTTAPTTAQTVKATVEPVKAEQSKTKASKN